MWPPEGFPRVLAVYQHCSLCDVVESGNQIDEGTGNVLVLTILSFALTGLGCMVLGILQMRQRNRRKAGEKL